MSAARKLYTFGGELSLCEPARRIVEPTPAEIIALNPRRPSGGRSRGRTGAIEGASFTDPSSIKSVQVIDWWRADSGVTVVTGASQWTGKLNGLNWVQATGAAQPTLNASDANFGNQASLTFDGVAQEMTLATAMPAAGTSPRCYWFVFRQISWANNEPLFSGAGGTAHIVFQISASPQIGQYNGSNANFTGNAAVGSARIGVASFTNTTSDFLRVGSVTTTGQNAGNGAAASMVLGSFGGAGFCNYALAELLITVSVPAELPQLQGYAVTRYGSVVAT